MLLKEANAISVELRKKVQFEDFSFLLRLLLSFFLLFLSFVRPLQSGHIVMDGRTDGRTLSFFIAKSMIIIGGARVAQW